MKRKEGWESVSLQWIHETRESGYRATKGLPLKAWLEPVNPEKATCACRRMGLKGRLRGGTARRRVKQLAHGSG